MRAAFVAVYAERWDAPRSARTDDTVIRVPPFSWERRAGMNRELSR